MKALVHTEPYVLEYKDVPVPERRDGEVLIKIEAVGICGSDVHGFTGRTGRRIPPVIMGHEAAGEIVEADTGSEYKPGDRVTFDSTIYCGECGFCKSGRVNLCGARRVIGVSCGDYLQDGAMAEFVAVPERILYRLPDNVDYRSASMIEPASVAYHAVSLAGDLTGKQVMVVGAGVIGLMLIQALKLAGCKSIVAADLDRNRLEVAESCGADLTIDSREQNPADFLAGNYPGGLDAVFEAVGIEATVNLAFSSTAKGGLIVLVGNVTPEVKFPLQRVVTTELTIFGSCASAGEYPAIIRDLADSKLNFERIITAAAPLQDGEKYFKSLLKGGSRHIKVILEP